MGILLALGYKIRPTVILTAVSLLVYGVLTLQNLRAWHTREYVHQRPRFINSRLTSLIYSIQKFLGRCKNTASLSHAPLSAYILYGALDTLKYAEVLEQILPARGVFVCVLLASVLLLGLSSGVFGKISAYLERSIIHLSQQIPQRVHQ